MLPGEREMLMDDCRMHSLRRSREMFGWLRDSLSARAWTGGYYKTTEGTIAHRIRTIEKFAREKMRDVCFVYLGEDPRESVPKRRA
mgnify:CR=1 FL=1